MNEWRAVDSHAINNSIHKTKLGTNSCTHFLEVNYCSSSGSIAVIVMYKLIENSIVVFLK